MLTFTLLLTACAPKTSYLPEEPKDQESSAPASIVSYSASEAAELLETKNATAVDVRNSAEFEKGHIKGAMSLPENKISSEPTYLLPVLDAPIIVYGANSASAAEKLVSAGYTNVGTLEEYESLAVETGMPEDKTGATNSFSSYLLNGVPADENIFADYKLTMINIWATYCSPCLNEMPELGELAAEYESKGVQIVGVITDIGMSDTGIYTAEDVSLARELVTLTKADYPHLLPSYTLYTALLSGVSAVPTTVFVDSEGSIVGEVYVGARSGEEWAKIIEGLL